METAVVVRRMKSKKAQFVFSLLLGIVLGVAISIPLTNRYGYWSLAWVGMVVAFVGVLVLVWRGGKDEG